jgi:hypothetical protein
VANAPRTRLPERLRNLRRERESVVNMALLNAGYACLPNVCAKATAFSIALALFTVS